MTIEELNKVKVGDQYVFIDNLLRHVALHEVTSVTKRLIVIKMVYHSHPYNYDPRQWQPRESEKKFFLKAWNDHNNHHSILQWLHDAHT